MAKCPACLASFGTGAFGPLASHLAERAAHSDSDHVRWLNQNISRKKMEPGDLETRLQAFYALDSRPLKDWIVQKFISKFYGPLPHPFVAALQHPSRAVLLGYVIEHQHFLRQWVRSCATIIAHTDDREVILYELDNLNTEFGGLGPDRLAHYELLLQMGESLGLSRATILTSAPLPATQHSIEGWQRIAEAEHWVDCLAAMHSLELIAHRDLVKQGASVHYFDPSILAGNEITAEAKAFLREGYEADVGHSEEALELVTRFAERLGRVEEVQSTFLRSCDLFDDYLGARLERAGSFES